MTINKVAESTLDNDTAMKIILALGIDMIHGEQGPLFHDALTQLKRLFKMFIELDCTMLEVNPWAVVQPQDALSTEMQMSIVDTKVTIDDSALYR